MRAVRSRRARLWTGLLAGVSLLGGLGCAERPASAAAAAEREAPPRPADSLIATAPGGAEIWFTLARADSGDGRACVDRTIEIRRSGARVPVPLLYTGTTPEIVNDTTLRARLSKGCRPGDAYLVDLRTGRPVREHR
ncbi:MAG: hypothetical protein ABJC36_02375 [Gemmatimonadales bacterium]